MKAVQSCFKARNRRLNINPSSSRSFLPFLYQTRTIQSGRWQLTTEQTEQSHEQPPWVPTADHIPFEKDGQVTAPDRPVRESTITDREREAFRKLFEMVVKNPPTKPHTSKDQSEEVKRTLRADAQQLEATELLEAAATRLRASTLIDNTAYVDRFPVPLRRMAAAATQKVQEQQHLQHIEEQLRAEEEAQRPATHDPVVRLQEEQHARIEGLLRTAPSDSKLYQVLEKEVFSVIRSLDLDKRSTKDKEASQVEEPLPSDPEQLAIIGPNYPSFLLIAIRQLRAHFPASTLPFQILPAIKKLGRSSYILGASTPLYNEIIAATWQILADFQKIDDLLKEMDNSGLEFDENTLRLLQQIQREGNRVLSGRQGELKRLWWDFELVRNGWNRVCEWIPVIQERLRALTLRLANEKEMQREQLEYETIGEH